jgi:hypothetical protein
MKKGLPRFSSTILTRRTISLGAACFLVAALLAVMLPGAHAQIFIADYQAGTISKYSLTGAVINDPLVADTGVGPYSIALSGNNIFVANYDAGTVGVYTVGGVAVNTSLISGLLNPTSVTVSGGSIYVVSGTANGNATVVGKYTTAGATQNAALLTLSDMESVAVSGTDLYVTRDSGIVGKYTTSGSVQNASFITGLEGPFGIAVNSTHVYVTDQTAGAVVKYTTAGVKISASLIAGLSNPSGIALSGNSLYLTDASFGTVGQYGLDGSVINAALITDLNGPTGIIVIPEPSAGALAGIIGFGWLLRRTPRSRGCAVC